MTPAQRDVLAHVVINPDTWWANAQTALGPLAQRALEEKVARWQMNFDAVKDHPNYKPRATRLNQEDAYTYVPE